MNGNEWAWRNTHIWPWSQKNISMLLFYSKELMERQINWRKKWLDRVLYENKMSLYLGIN